MDNLHRDFIPVRVVEHIKSTLVRGIIIKVRFKKVHNRTILQLIWPRRKDVYFWLPYKNVVDATNKYSVVGSKSRYPYAKMWFEVKPTSEIYTQGLSDFVFYQQQMHEHTKEIRLIQPFLTSELLTLTRKKVIKILDDFVFTKQTTTEK
jgi:hypothetical protein